VTATPITVVIPNWNGARFLARILKDLREQTLPPTRIVVVDGGSGDDSAGEVARQGAELLQLPFNRGFAAAVNAGLRLADTPLVSVLNNDVELERDWLERLAAALLMAEGAGTFFATGKIYQIRRPELLDGTFDLVSRGLAAWRAGNGRPDGPVWDQPRPIQFAPWTAVLFKRTIFDRAGYLNEMFESYLEDVDFGLRCAAAGASGVYVPEAICRHWGSGTLGVWHPETVRRISRNQLFLLARHRVAGTTWPAVVSQLLWGGVALRHWCLLAYLRGKAEGLRQFGAMREDAHSSPNLLKILRKSETELKELQSQTGCDLYWRVYFALT
jgi:GT2 family glycosyltransferase